MSHFFAYLSRMKLIRRWALMYSAHAENVQEHSLRVAHSAHALAVIRNRLFGHEAYRTREAAVRERLLGMLPEPLRGTTRRSCRASASRSTSSSR